MRRYVYLDYAATTPVDKRVMLAMKPYFCEKFGNSSSLHKIGQEALVALDLSREILKNFIGAEFLSEIIFTSSATESNNLAIKGTTFFYRFKRKIKPHLITSSIEHPSVYNVFKNLSDLEIAEVDFVKPDRSGLIEINEISSLIRENTVLVSLHHVNSEIGVVQNVAQVGEFIENLNKHRDLKIAFHIDAAQSCLTEEVDVRKFKCHFLTLSAHKIYGPKGIGLLYIRKDIQNNFVPLFSGGEQEYELRPSTVAVALAVGFAKAVEIVQKEFTLLKRHLTDIRDYFLLKIKELNVESNTDVKVSTPKIFNLYFPSKESQDILFFLDQNGFAVSAGTACTAKALMPSRTVKEVFRDENRAKRSIRFSFGRETKREDLDLLIEVLKKFL